MDQELNDLASEIEQQMLDNGTEKLAPSGRPQCPVCKEEMKVENYHGISVDVCELHGVWFDAGELPTLIERVKARAAASARSGERSKRIEAVRQAKNEGKRAGTLFGVLSFLFD